MALARLAEHAPRRRDVVFALTAGVLMALGSVVAAIAQAPPRRAPDVVYLLLLGVAVLAIAVRRGVPRGALAVTAVGSGVLLALGYPHGPMLLALGIALYTVAERLPTRAATLACAPALGAVATVEVVTDLARDPGGGAGGSTMLTVLAVVPWLVGVIQRTRAGAGEIADRERHRRRVRDRQLELTRDVHNLVGTGLATITMRASVALHVLDRQPEQARPALEAIRAASTRTLEELRSTLVVFRDCPPAGDRLVPGLRQLDTLVAVFADAGFPVEVRYDGGTDDLPPAVDVVGYQVTRLALTSIREHSDAAAATVRITASDGELVLDVASTEPSEAAPAADEPVLGQALDGIRARVAALSGVLEYGSAGTAGVRVRVRIPKGEPTR